MKIYQLIRKSLTEDGYHNYDETLGFYIKEKNINLEKSRWETAWLFNTINHICKYPCWFDSEPELIINEIETKD